jgi:tRNA pseudouridine(38-40) synthase
MISTPGNCLFGLLKTRYDCKSRTYKYFFLKGAMDIEVMRQASQKYVGEHDFRNFCKLNITDTVSFKYKDLFVSDFVGEQSGVLILRKSTKSHKL